MNERTDLGLAVDPVLVSPSLQMKKNPFFTCWFLARTKVTHTIPPTHRNTAPLIVRAFGVVWQSQISRKAIMLLGKGTDDLFPHAFVYVFIPEVNEIWVSFVTAVSQCALPFNFSQLTTSTAEVNTKRLTYCVRKWEMWQDHFWPLG